MGISHSHSDTLPSSSDVSNTSTYIKDICDMKFDLTINDTTTLTNGNVTGLQIVYYTNTCIQDTAIIIVHDNKQFTHLKRPLTLDHLMKLIQYNRTNIRYILISWMIYPDMKVIPQLIYQEMKRMNGVSAYINDIYDTDKACVLSIYDTDDTYIKINEICTNITLGIITFICYSDDIMMGG